MSYNAFMEWWQSFFDETIGAVLFPEEAWQRAEENCDALIALMGLAPEGTLSQLKVLGYYGGLHSEPWSLDSNRLVIIAERPA